MYDLGLDREHIHERQHDPEDLIHHMIIKHSFLEVVILVPMMRQFSLQR